MFHHADISIDHLRLTTHLSNITHSDMRKIWMHIPFYFFRFCTYWKCIWTTTDKLCGAQAGTIVVVCTVPDQIEDATRERSARWAHVYGFSANTETRFYIYWALYESFIAGNTQYMVSFCQTINGNLCVTTPSRHSNEGAPETCDGSFWDAVISNKFVQFRLYFSNILCI